MDLHQTKEAAYMQTSVTFKNIDPSDHLKTYVGDKLNRFDKYLYNPAEANVVLSVEKFRHIAEISIAGDRLNLNGKEETEDMYSAIDMALDKIEKQIKKSKQKTRERRAGKGRNLPLWPIWPPWPMMTPKKRSSLKTSITNPWTRKKPLCRWNWWATLFWFSQMPIPARSTFFTDEMTAILA
jgi:ribosomal subunit interface protein